MIRFLSLVSPFRRFDSPPGFPFSRETESAITYFPGFFIFGCRTRSGWHLPRLDAHRVRCGPAVPAPWTRTGLPLAVGSGESRGPRSCRGEFRVNSTNGSLSPWKILGPHFRRTHTLCFGEGQNVRVQVSRTTVYACGRRILMVGKGSHGPGQFGCSTLLSG